MPVQYGGLPANITGPSASITIASSTNATPIVVTTSSAHGLIAGDWVFIQKHTTNTAANGLWLVGAVTSTTLTLTGAVGVGVGGASGYIQGFAFGATGPEPSDGDALTA